MKKIQKKMLKGLKLPLYRMNFVITKQSGTKQSKSKRVTFVVTYHPLLKSFQSLINKHLNVLYLDERKC